jgi:phosphoserine phosphatase RsbU/P
MDRIGTDFIDIANGLFVLFAGLIAIVISLFRLKSKDFSLFNLGLFCTIYGLRWLMETPTMVTLVGFPFTVPYFHAVLTYIVVIPLSAFLVEVFGRGIYDSLIWFFRSTVLYAVAAVIYDLFSTKTLSDASINPIVVVIWCLVTLVNLALIKNQKQSELNVVRAGFIFLFITVAIDNMVNINFFSSNRHLEHGGFLVLIFTLGYVAVKHFISNEKKLLEINQEMEIARRIQHFNLPGNLPSIEGLDIAARYIPMSAVAGDFYDIQIKDKNGVGILIADVSGHGVGAALISSMLKIAYASQAQHIADCARVLKEINKILQGKIEDSFVTACSLFIDLEQGVIRYSNAGHPPPILWKKSRKESQNLSKAGTILGPFPNSTYENFELDIVKGDRIILYTDGIAESKNKSGEFFGDDQIQKYFEEYSSDSVELTANKFIDHLFKWSRKAPEASLDDDLTLIIIDFLSGRER